MTDPSREGYTFEEITDRLNDKNECKRAKAEVKKQHMKNVYIDIEARKRCERRKMRDCK